MRIGVIHQLNPGGHNAYEINVVKTAGGFARLGHPPHDVTIYCLPALQGVTLEQAATMYAEPTLRWRPLPADHPALTHTDPEQRSKAFGRWAGDAARDDRCDLVYARHMYGARAAAFNDLPTAMETHAYLDDPNPLLQKCLEQTARPHHPIAALITINPLLAHHYIERGANAARTRVVPDGVDLELFRRPAETPLAPRPFERTTSATHAVYTGSMHDWKGVPTILACARTLPDTTFHLVGARDDAERDRLLANAPPNVRVVTRRAHTDLPAWLHHADVLLLPTTEDDPSHRWTSPVKLGEYLASGTPIVASRIDGIATWVGEPGVTWAAPGDPRSLASAIARALDEPAPVRATRTSAALALATRLSYPNRARAILDALGVAQNA